MEKEGKSCRRRFFGRHGFSGGGRGKSLCAVCLAVQLFAASPGYGKAGQEPLSAEASGNSGHSKITAAAKPGRKSLAASPAVSSKAQKDLKSFSGDPASKDGGRPPEGWRRPDFFLGPGEPQIFVSEYLPEIIVSVSQASRRKAPLPDSEQAFQKLEKRKRRAIQKIQSISQWTPDFYFWDRNSQTLFLKGHLIRRDKTVFFKEWHFYSENQIISILMESQKDFSRGDGRIVRFLNYIRQSAEREKGI